MKHPGPWIGVLLLAITVMAGACTGGKDFAYHSDNEVPQGRGIFSSEDGYFTIYRKDAEPMPVDPQEAIREEATPESAKTPE